MKRYLYNIIPLVLMLALMQGCRDKQEDDIIVPEPFNRLQSDQTFQSSILKRKVSYAVILPEGYDTTNVSYPVIYLLHGFGDDYTAWYKGGKIQQYVDNYRNAIGQVILVMPDGGNSYWVNRYNGQYQIMDMLVNEMTNVIDTAYRTIKDAEARAVMGYSMGGYGALVTVAKNPEVFFTCVSLSMSFRTDSQYLAEPQEIFDYQWGSVFGGRGKSGDERLTPYFMEYSPFHFFNNPDDPSYSSQNYYLACGDDEESLDVTNQELHDLMSTNGIEHTYSTGSGGHSWTYWHREMPKALEFIGNSFGEFKR
jgi:enterochelin esterase-like enzyme